MKDKELKRIKKRNKMIFKYIFVIGILLFGIMIGNYSEYEDSCDLCPIREIIKEPCEYSENNFYYKGSCENVDMLLEKYLEKNG